MSECTGEGLRWLWRCNIFDHICACGGVCTCSIGSAWCVALKEAVYDFGPVAVFGDSEIRRFGDSE